MDRTLTRILLARSNLESATPENNDIDGFCRWTSQELCGVRIAPNDCELATREAVETTRPVASRHFSNPVAATYLSYNDLIEGGCVNRLTFHYVPDNGAYLAFKTAVRSINQGKQRRRYGLGRSGKTRSAQVGDAGGSAISRQVSCDDQLNSLTPRLNVHQQHNNHANQTSCDDTDLTEQPATVDLLPGYQCAQEKDAMLSRARRDNKKTATCSGDEISTGQEQHNRVIKTWLYNFLPPIATTQLGDGDADSLRRNSAEARDNDFPPSMSRTVKSGRGRDQCPSDEQHPAVVSRMPRTQPGDRDHEAGSTSGQQRQLQRSATSVASVHSDGQRAIQTAVVDRRRRRSFTDTPSDDCPVFLTETCLLQHCDCSHHEDATAVTSRTGEDDNDDDRDYKSNINDDDDDDVNDEDEEEKEKEAPKSALKSFNSRLNELEMNETHEQLQLSLTGHVIDIRRRHQESCKS